MASNIKLRESLSKHYNGCQKYTVMFLSDLSVYTIFRKSHTIKVLIDLFILLLIFISDIGIGYADFVLPDSLITIDEYAFFGTATEYVKFPDGMESIGERAFSDNNNLILVYLPDSIISIDKNAFDNSSLLLFYGYANSYGVEWAKAQHRRIKTFPVLETNKCEKLFHFFGWNDIRKEKLIAKSVNIPDTHNNVNCRLKNEGKAGKGKRCSDYRIDSRAPPFLTF